MQNAECDESGRFREFEGRWEWWSDGVVENLAA